MKFAGDLKKKKKKKRTMHCVGLLRVSKRNEKLVPVVSLLKTVVGKLIHLYCNYRVFVLDCVNVLNMIIF